MRTAQVQGDLWSARTQDWADLQERLSIPLFEAVFERLKVGNGMRLLDVGCGAGGAAQIAARRGAWVSGLDASGAMIEIARKRVSDGDFSVGEIEELPYADNIFNAVVGFNSFQYAGDPVAALQEAKRVTSSGGQVVMAIWGRPQDCEHAGTLKAVGSLLPPPPPGAGGPFALSDPGKVEALMEQAGLQPIDSGEADCPFEYPDAETAWRAVSSAGPVIRAIRHAGEERTKQAIIDSMAPYKTHTGSYLQENKFRFVIATA
jgi:SAM-dependent methyltransferase